MPLSQDFKWKAFKKATNILGKSGGANMELVDNALKSYWEGIEIGTGSAQALANLLALVKATNTWFKKKKAKKDANVGGQRKVKEHFVTRWNKLVALGKASLAQAKQLATNLGLLLGRTKCDILVTDASGWRDVQAAEIIQAEGQLSTNHPKAFGF